MELPDYAWLRLGHAQVIHFEMGEMLEGWIGDQRPELVADPEPNDGWIVWRMNPSAPAPPPRLGVLFGDWVHALRAVLDNLVFDMGGGPALEWKLARQLEFPFTYREQDWIQARKRLTRLGPGALRVLERWQPCKSDRRETLLLRSLNDMCNVDKHQVVVPAMFAAIPRDFEFHLGWDSDAERNVGIRRASGSMFRPGEEVVRVRAWDDSGRATSPVAWTGAIRTAEVVFFFETKNRHEVMLPVDKMADIGAAVETVADELWAARKAGIG